MWTQRWDLHSHSTHSDGQHDVATVADLMARNGVETWALTDHDTAAGWVEGATQAEARGLHFLPGVEITCEPVLAAQSEELTLRGQERPSTSWHLLAYFPTHDPRTIDENMAAFLAWLGPKQNERAPRMALMCERLTELGMPVELNSVLARATGSVGRPHLADEMVHLGYVKDRQEAFETWIGDGLPAFVSHSKPTIAEATNMVHKAGGIVSLAHPRYYGVPTSELIPTLSALGVDAVEAVHRSHDQAYRNELMVAAEASGLHTSVGSDFHGLDVQPRPGHMPVPLASLHPALTGASPGEGVRPTRTAR